MGGGGRNGRCEDCGRGVGVVVGGRVLGAVLGRWVYLVGKWVGEEEKEKEEKEEGGGGGGGGVDGGVGGKEEEEEGDEVDVRKEEEEM